MSWAVNDHGEPACPYPLCAGFGREERVEGALTWYRCAACGGDFYAEKRKA